MCVNTLVHQISIFGNSSSWPREFWTLYSSATLFNAPCLFSSTFNFSIPGKIQAMFRGVLELVGTLGPMPNGAMYGYSLQLIIIPRSTNSTRAADTYVYLATSTEAAQR